MPATNMTTSMRIPITATARVNSRIARLERLVAARSARSRSISATLRLLAL